MLATSIIDALRASPIGAAGVVLFYDHASYTTGQASSALNSLRTSYGCRAMSIVGWLFLLAVGAVTVFAVSRLLRLLFGRRTPKQMTDDAGDVADAAKVGLTALAVATFLLAPAGVMAILAGVGLVSVPTIVRLAPGLALIFGGLALLASVARIYARRKSQQQRNESDLSH
jgi:TRAP-type C4-dicarboxylate transport system permease small subunit